MGIRIVKFGGTSISDDERCQYALDIVKEKSLKDKIVVVISAMGRMGDPYATDTLASLGNEYLSEQEKARLLSTGEIVSSIRFSSKLRAMGINAYALSFKEGGIITDDNYNCAEILECDATEIKREIEEYDVLVVCGFIGMNHAGEITTLGRGGSDYTAVLVAKMLKVDEVEIYTDVDGIYDSDPKLNKKAKRYKEITYHNMLSLHCRVLHDRSVDFAARNNIRILLKGTFSKGDGTIVRHDIR